MRLGTDGNFLRKHAYQVVFTSWYVTVLVVGFLYGFESRSAIAQLTTLASGIFAAFGLLLVVMRLRRPGGAG